MVKIEDGSTLTLSRLLGEAQDDDGRPLKFERNDDTNNPSDIPSWKAEVDMTDNSNRKKTYHVDLGNTLVRVSVAIQNPEALRASSQETEPSPPPKSKEEREEEEKQATQARIVKTEVQSQQQQQKAKAKL